MTALTKGARLGRYEIRSLLGVGGMGEVYLAQDHDLGRTVAIKILPESLAANPQRLQRFVQEAKAASALNHPNILTIHEIGSFGSSRFIATEFIDGVTLKTHLHNGMSLEECLEVALGVASALAAAHDAGIVHRDIKPENIMVRRDGYVKVLDFGVAKLTEQQGEVADPEAETKEMVNTGAGVIIGTPNYMSPEQAKGTQVDGRSDLWSIGVVLYELLSGSLPFHGETPTETISLILQKDPTPLTRLAPAIPPELERIVTKALTKERNERYQNAKDLIIDLRNLKRRVEVEAEIDRMPKSKESSPVTDQSVAVLPFANNSNDPSLDYLADGFAETIINNLSHLKGLRVKASGSSFRFRGREGNVIGVGHELVVSAVVTGKLFQLRERLVVRVALVDALTGDQMWGEQYDRSLADLIDVQVEISTKVARQLQLRLTGDDERRLIKRATESPDAYRAYLKGRYIWAKRPQTGFAKGLDYFRQAIELDPAYALAYAGLSDAYAVLGSWEAGLMPPREAANKARAAALKALEIDDELAEAHTSLAHVLLHYDWDWSAAETGFARALELNPNYVHAHHWYSHLCVVTGKNEKAYNVSLKALELDPLDLILNVHLAWHHWITNEPSRALEQSLRIRELEPNSPWPHFFSGLAHEQEQRFARAIEELKIASELSVDTTFALAAHGHALGLANEQQKAIGVLHEVEGSVEQHYVPSYDKAIVHLGLGDRDRAMEYLQKAYEESSSWMAYLKVEPRLDPLREDDRFVELMRLVGFH